MMTITIRLPDVEAAMLVEMQKVNKAYGDLLAKISAVVREQYLKSTR